jgi:hypothetical protein
MHISSIYIYTYMLISDLHKLVVFCLHKTMFLMSANHFIIHSSIPTLSGDLACNHAGGVLRWEYPQISQIGPF